MPVRALGAVLEPRRARAPGTPPAPPPHPPPPPQSELDYVVNEESELQAANFPASGPSPFDIPASAPPCIPVGSPRSHSEAVALVKAAGGNPLALAALPEVRLARTLHKRALAKA